MKKLKEYIMRFIQGFCMAMADSVPGVSGGTIAFLLEFYDDFINSLDDLFKGNLQQKKEGLVFLSKIRYRLGSRIFTMCNNTSKLI